MLNILSILLDNEPGALSRVIGLFSQRGYNIETLTVIPDKNPNLSHLNIHTIGNKKTLEQIKKQLQKLINVIHVNNLQCKINNYIEREILLVKVRVNSSICIDIQNYVNVFCGQIIGITSFTYLLQMVGNNNKINSFLNILYQLTEVIEIVRSDTINIIYY